MTRRKNDLERRIDELLGEREGLSSTLDDSSDKILMLERQSREQESQVDVLQGLSTISKDLRDLLYIKHSGLNLLSKMASRGKCFISLCLFQKIIRAKKNSARE